MNKNKKFWKIILILFLAWLFLFLWVSRYQVEQYLDRVIKLDRFTGKVYSHHYKRGWEELK